MELVKQKSVQINVKMLDITLSHRNGLEQILVQKYNLANYPTIPNLLTKDQYKDFTENCSEENLEKVYNLCSDIKNLHNSDKSKFEGFFVITSILKYYDNGVITDTMGNFVKNYESEIAHILAVMEGDMEPAFLNGGIFDVPN